MTFAELLEDLGVPTADENNPHQGIGWVNFDCPFCGRNSNSFHMGYNLAGGYCNCWKCGGHKTVNVLMELSGKSFRECQQILNNLDTESPISAPKIAHTGRLRIPQCVGPMQKAHYEYLDSRRHNPHEIKRLWNVGGIGIAPGLFSWRLFIPIRYQFETVSWTTRAIGKRAAPRYINASTAQESMSAKTLLYGEEYCQHTIIVCEGVFDAWRIGPGAVATLGMSFSQAQVLRISKYARRVICFDNSFDAQARAKELCRLLMSFPGETLRVNLSGKDPDTSPETEIEELRKRFLKA